MYSPCMGKCLLLATCEAANLYFVSRYIYTAKYVYMDMYGYAWIRVDTRGLSVTEEGISVL